jgi:hypothetical protein
MSLVRVLLRRSRRSSNAGLTVSELILIVAVAAIAIGGAWFSISRMETPKPAATPVSQPGGKP